MKQIVLLALLMTCSYGCGEGVSEVEEVSAEEVVSVTADIQFSEESDQFTVVSETSSQVAENQFACQIELVRGTVISFELENIDRLVLNGEPLERLSDYAGTDSIEGVAQELFGTWQFVEPSTVRNEGH